MQPATIKQFAIESFALVNYTATIDELPDGSFSVKHNGVEEFVARQNQDKRDWMAFSVIPSIIPNQKRDLSYIGEAHELIDAFRLVAFAVYGSLTSDIEVKLADQESRTTPQVHTVFVDGCLGAFQPTNRQ
jgi:hypothetical protein